MVGELTGLISQPAYRLWELMSSQANIDGLVRFHEEHVSRVIEGDPTRCIVELQLRGLVEYRFRQDKVLVLRVISRARIAPGRALTEQRR